jgi:hypothetical protein
MLMSRRVFLVSSTAAFAGLAAKGGLVVTDDLGFMRTTLHRLLGEVRISDADLGRFIAAFRSSWSGFNGYKGRFRKLSEFSGLTSLADAVPALRPGYIERYERLVLTNFLVWTDHSDASRAGRETVFIGPAACLNPFAKFSFD